MGDAVSPGMLTCTPTFDRYKNVLDNGALVHAPKKRMCCIRRLGTTMPAESEISLESLDGYVFCFVLFFVLFFMIEK